MSLAQVGEIRNPCQKRTLMMGPKKFIGMKPNQQIHQHTSKKVQYTDFDTYSRVMSSKNTFSQQLTASGSQSKHGGIRSVKSNVIRNIDEHSPESNNYGQSMDNRSNRMVSGVLSDQMDSTSFNSIGFKSGSLLGLTTIHSNKKSDAQRKNQPIKTLNPFVKSATRFHQNQVSISALLENKSNQDVMSRDSKSGSATRQGNQKFTDMAKF